MIIHNPTSKLSACMAGGKLPSNDVSGIINRTQTPPLEENSCSGYQ
jgi:hypothetical protein